MPVVVGGVGGVELGVSLGVADAVKVDVGEMNAVVEAEAVSLGLAVAEAVMVAVQVSLGVGVKAAVVKSVGVTLAVAVGRLGSGAKATAIPPMQ